MEFFRLEELCSDIIDCPHSTPQWLHNGVPVIRNFNLDNGRFNFSSASYVDEKTYYDRIKRAKPETEDIIISREAPMGTVAIVPKDFKCCLGQRLVLLKVNKTKCNPYYLIYTLMSDYVQTQIKRADLTGSIVSNLNIPDLKSLIIPIANRTSQDKMTNILMAIDDKIENNNRINDNLQQQAKLLYDYWFTQFDFPDESGKPYRSSGGLMKWNEELHCEIPQGWKCVSLNELLCKNNKAFDYASVQPTVDLSVMPSASISLNKLNTSDAFTTNLFEMKEGDILFGSIRPYLKKAGIAPCNGVVAGTIHSYRPIKDSDYNFALLTISRDTFFDYAVRVSNGTKMPVISSDDLLAYKLPYSEKIAEKFNEYNLKQIICRNIQETQHLISIRDWLLPMLMTGQATVPD